MRIIHVNYIKLGKHRKWYRRIKNHLSHLTNLTIINILYFQVIEILLTHNIWKFKVHDMMI